MICNTPDHVHAGVKGVVTSAFWRPPSGVSRPQRASRHLVPRRDQLHSLRARADPAKGPTALDEAAPMATTQAPVAVVTTLGCPYCKKAKAALQDAGISYEELELSEQLEALTRIKELTGQATVPQIFVGGKLIGGASDLLPQLEDGRFQQLLASAPADPLTPELRAVIVQSQPLVQAKGLGSTSADEAQALAAGLRSAGPARDAAPDGSFALQAAADWVAASQKLGPEAAVEALARLQAAQLLTVAEAPFPHRGGVQLPLLGKVFQKREPWQWEGEGEGDVAISPALLRARPRARVRLVREGGEAPPQLGRPLNTHFRWFGPARPAAEVAEGVRRALLQLYDRHLAGDGKKVDYAALRSDPGWREFVNATAELQKVDVSSLARDQRMAFFINIYNALVVHALVVLGPATDALGRVKWFGGIKYVIGGYQFSSNDIEHGVLRSNAPSPAALWSLLGRPQWAGRTFKAGDPRAKLAVTPMDPRIHFSLNCGANSCPPIRVYSPDNLEFGLSTAAAAFCESDVQVHPDRQELSLSMLLKWYGGDFGTKADLLRFLTKYLPAGPKAQLEGMLAGTQDVEQDIKLTFRPYDWGVNSK